MPSCLFNLNTVCILQMFELVLHMCQVSFRVHLLSSNSIRCNEQSGRFQASRPHHESLEHEQECLPNHHELQNHSCIDIP